MTTTQPPLKPGDRVHIEAVAELDQGQLALRPVSVNPDRPYRGLAEPTRCVWHRMPDPTSPESDAAAHIAELARLRSGLAERGFPPLWTADTDALAAVDTLRQGRDAARAELDRMRKVVAAAEALAQAERALDAEDVPGADLAPFADAAYRARETLAATVDAFRAGQNAPASPPQATQGHEQAQDGPSDGSAHSDAPRAPEAVIEHEPAWLDATDPEQVDLLTHRDPITGFTTRLTVIAHHAQPLQVDLCRDSEPFPRAIARIPRDLAIQLGWDILTTYDPNGAPFDEAARLAHQAMRREMDHLERCLARLGVPFCTPFDVDHPTPVEAALIEIERLRNLAGGDASTWSPAQPGETPGQVEPDDARPQPTDPPARRDWAGEIERAVRGPLAALADDLVLIDADAFGNALDDLVDVPLFDLDECELLVDQDYRCTYCGHSADDHAEDGCERCYCERRP